MPLRGRVSPEKPRSSIQRFRKLLLIRYGYQSSHDVEYILSGGPLRYVANARLRTLVSANSCNAGVKMMSVSGTDTAHAACPLGRRIGAMIYDALILIAIWMLGTAIVVVAISKPVDSGNPLFTLYLLALAFAYFHLSWSRIGQTLGMRTWRIRLDPGPSAFTLARGLKRFVAGLFSFLSLGLGFAWGLIRSDRRTWSDLASESRLVIVPANGRRSQSSAQQQESQKAE